MLFNLTSDLSLCILETPVGVNLDLVLFLSVHLYDAMKIVQVY